MKFCRNLSKLFKKAGKKVKQASGWLFSIEIPEKSQPLAFFVRLFSKKPVALHSPATGAPCRCAAIFSNFFRS